MGNYKEKYKLWTKQNNLPLDLKAELNAMKDDEDLIKEAFFEELSFGTSGLRGIMGAGTSRLNLPIIEKVTQGLSNYLNKNLQGEGFGGDQRLVLISYDTRHNSLDFAMAAAQVLGANNIRAMVFPRPTPVSILSYAIRELKADVGIMITASHNAKIYNGYKVYNSLGGQILTDQAKDILAEINDVKIFEDPVKIGFDEGINSGLIEYIGDEVIDTFIDKNIESSFGSEGTGSLKVVYTPLNGSGLGPVLKNLEKIGVKDVHVVKEQEGPDGDFPFCPKPNPEYEQVYNLGQKMIKELDADFMLATDPDCDRAGVALGHRMLKGNHIGVLLFEYILRKRKERGEDISSKVGVRSIVSTPLFDAIAKDFGAKVETTLIGFKYIGQKMDDLGDRFVFGFEEGNGFLGVNHMRDKDGVSTCMLFCQMAADHKARGKSIEEALDDIYKKYGYYDEKVVSFVFEGLEGNKRREKIMSVLRSNIEDEIQCQNSLVIKDYKEQKVYTTKGTKAFRELPVANILEYETGDGFKLIVRPSGTEPLLKVYLFGRGRSFEEAQAGIKRLEDRITTIVNEAQ